MGGEENELEYIPSEEEIAEIDSDIDFENAITGRKDSIMKSYIQLKKIASVYYDLWTSDGVDIFHSNPEEVSEWLRNKAIYTTYDSVLDDLTGDEIDNVASMIAEMVNDNLVKER